MSWFFYVVSATILLGISMFFYKFPSAKKLSRYNVSFWSLSTSLVLATIFFYQHLNTTSSTMLLIALLWGASFFLLSLSQMYALGHLETNTLFPVTSILSLLLTILIGLAFFRDKISLVEGFGALLVISTVYFYIFDGVRFKYSSKILGVGLLIVFLSASNKILQKLAADSVNVQAFQIYQYLFGAILAFVTYLFVNKKGLGKEIFSGLKIGSAIGVFSFFGGYLLIMALTGGPLSLVFSIFALYTLVTAVFGYIFFKEKLTKRKLFLLFMAIVATIVIKLG